MTAVGLLVIWFLPSRVLLHTSGVRALVAFGIGLLVVAAAANVGKIPHVRRAGTT